MILLVPISPEVPKIHLPRLWPGLVFIIMLCLCFLEIHDTLVADSRYVETLQTYVIQSKTGKSELKPEGHQYLKLRPLLKLAPSSGDWDLKRLLFANFIHGNIPHLFLNLVGAFAGARICATFIPFLATFSIFLLGGTVGLWVSLMLSSEISQYIPHVGASAGIFALMGTYYVFNFKYRTRYFFWFPSRRAGFISLRTSWFFFVDVLLLELVLSAAQLFPSRIDSVDHLAHVIGFGAGAGLAYLLRLVMKWPSFLQTRGEFLYWSKISRPKDFDPFHSPFEKWIQILELNRYNDQLKMKLLQLVFRDSKKLNESEIEQLMLFISPTFIRLHSDYVGALVKELSKVGKRLPPTWLAQTPYDSVIRIAKEMTSPPDEQYLLYKFITEYRAVQHEGSEVDRKLELLTTKISTIMPGAGATPQPTSSPGLAENPDTDTSDKTRSLATENSSQEKATKAS